MAGNRKDKAADKTAEDWPSEIPVENMPADEMHVDASNVTIDAQEVLGETIGFRAAIDKAAFDQLNTLCDVTGLTRNECVEMAIYTLFAANKDQVEARLRAMMNARTERILQNWG